MRWMTCRAKQREVFIRARARRSELQGVGHTFGIVSVKHAAIPEAVRDFWRCASSLQDAYDEWVDD